jgi:hypothetical protein
MQVAIIHNHPIHYKHLLFQEPKNRRMGFDVLIQALPSDIGHEKIPLACVHPAIASSHRHWGI